MDIPPVFVSSKTIRSLNVPYSEIRYFEGRQIRALLNSPGRKKWSERRNRTILIFGYDAAMRVGKLTGLKVGDLHPDAEIPYIRILGKGEKYRSVPLINKTVQHLYRYLGELHSDTPNLTAPLFYAATHDRIHSLSEDCVQKLLKKYAGMRESVCRPMSISIC